MLGARWKGGCIPTSVGLEGPERSPIALLCQEQKLLCVARAPLGLDLFSYLSPPFPFPSPLPPFAPSLQPETLVGGGNTMSF